MSAKSSQVNSSQPEEPLQAKRATAANQRTIHHTRYCPE